MLVFNFDNVIIQHRQLYPQSLKDALSSTNTVVIPTRSVLGAYKVKNDLT